MFVFRNFVNAPTNNSTAGCETPQILSKSKVNFRANNSASVLSLF